MGVNLNQILHCIVFQPKTNIYSLMCCPLYHVYITMHIIIRILSFGQDPIVLRCRYPRTVTATSNVLIEASTSEPTVGTGDLSYTMTIVGGALGGNTEFTISPNHAISGISPR